MRLIERIDPFLSRVDIPHLLSSMWYDRDYKDLIPYTDEVIDLICDESFIRRWKNYPDLRFGQFMFNEGHGIFNELYHLEESSILIKCGWKKTESYGFLSYVDDEGNLTDKKEYKFIDQFTPQAIQKIISDVDSGTISLHQFIVDLFKEELECKLRTK